MYVESSKQTVSRSASTQLQTHEVERSNVTTATQPAEKSFGAVDSFLQRLQSYAPDKPLAQTDIEQLRRAEEERRKVEEAEEKDPSRLYADSDESSAVPTFEEQVRHERQCFQLNSRFVDGSLQRIWRFSSHQTFQQDRLPTFAADGKIVQRTQRGFGRMLQNKRMCSLIGSVGNHLHYSGSCGAST